jgi:hypothetical protein
LTGCAGRDRPTTTCCREVRPICIVSIGLSIAKYRPDPGRVTLPNPTTVFDEIKAALHDLLHGNVTPEGRRDLLGVMKETLVHARLAVDDLRQAANVTRQRLEAERRELETIRRRKGLAQQIADAETVDIATRFESQHAEREAVLERKLDAQQTELALAEQDVEEMTRQFKAAVAGVGSGMPGGTVPDPIAPDLGMDDARSRLEQEIDSMGRAKRRAAAEAEADERLAELKRRMGR